MAVARLARFRVDPVDIGQMLTRRAPRSTRRAEITRGPDEARLTRIDEETWLDIRRCESADLVTRRSRAWGLRGRESAGPFPLIASASAVIPVAPRPVPNFETGACGERGGSALTPSLGDRRRRAVSPAQRRSHDRTRR
jgi:hypothetical protein